MDCCSWKLSYKKIREVKNITLRPSYRFLLNLPQFAVAANQGVEAHYTRFSYNNKGFSERLYYS